MISYTQQRTLYGDLSQNTTASNLTRGSYLSNIEHRYLLQKYFSNEASFSITTVGGFNLVITAAPAIGATSATLTSAWVYPTDQTYVTFSDGEVRLVNFIYNSTAITWQNPLTGTSFTLTSAPAAAATSATLATAWAYSTGARVTQFTDGEQKTVTYTSGSTAITWSGGLSGAVSATLSTSICTTAIGVGGLQTYNLPPDYSKLKTGTLTIGNLKWTPTEILSRQEWDNLNVFPYYADIPNNFFIYQNKFNLWPIPSTTGNIISFNYKRRIPDLSLADYATGTVSVANGGISVTGSGTSFTPTVNVTSESRWIQFPQPTGDNLWYQVQSVDSATGITLMTPYQGVTIAGGVYNLGQMPLLLEDFQDMLVWKPLMFYWGTIKENKTKYAEFKGLYDEKLHQLEEYCGTKTVNVNLSRTAPSRNPNLYSQSVGQ